LPVVFGIGITARSTGEGERLRWPAQVGGEAVDQPLAVDEPAQRPGGGEQPERRPKQGD
jgi:hypothetical protein